MKKTLEWQIATVTRIQPETPTVKILTFSLPSWDPHLPGQHYDIRLTDSDGYQTERSYSIASEPARDGEIDLTVERLEDGEVSPYLDDDWWWETRSSCAARSVATSYGKRAWGDLCSW